MFPNANPLELWWVAAQLFAIIALLIAVAVALLRFWEYKKPLEDGTHSNHGGTLLFVTDIVVFVTFLAVAGTLLWLGLAAINAPEPVYATLKAKQETDARRGAFSYIGFGFAAFCVLYSVLRWRIDVLLNKGEGKH